MAHKRRRKSGSRKRRRMNGNQSFAPSVISGTKKRRTYRPVRKHKRRSRIGAVDNTMKTGAGVLVGVLTGIIVNKFAPDSMKGKMLAAGKTLVGGVTAYAGRKNPLAFGFGLGLAAQGAGESAKEFGIVKGIEEFMSGVGAKSDEMVIEMNGTPSNAGRLMSGAGERQVMPSVISGTFMSGTGQVQPSVIEGAGDNF